MSESGERREMGGVWRREKGKWCKKKKESSVFYFDMCRNIMELGKHSWRQGGKTVWVGEEEHYPMGAYATESPKEDS